MVADPFQAADPEDSFQLVVSQVIQQENEKSNANYEKKDNQVNKKAPKKLAELMEDNVAYDLYNKLLQQTWNKIAS